MKKKVVKIAKVLGIVMLLVLIAGGIGMSWFTGRAMVEGALKMNTNEQTKENSLKELDDLGFSVDAFLEKYQDTLEVVSIPSSKGTHQITADYITSDITKDKDTIILVHGLGGDRVCMYPMAEFFLEKGYNVLSYDQRGAGDNLAEYTTFGYLESEDLQDCVDYIRMQVGKEKRVGILGQSMGAVTAGFYSGKVHASENIDFVILDSPFNDMYDMIEAVMYDMNTGIPVPYLMFCGNIATKLEVGFFYKDMNVAKSIRKSTVPTMVIHSKIDKVCPYADGEEIFEAIPHENKYFYTTKDVEHIMGFYEDRENYEKEVMNFIER